MFIVNKSHEKMKTNDTVNGPDICDDNLSVSRQSDSRGERAKGAIRGESVME